MLFNFALECAIRKVHLEDLSVGRKIILEWEIGGRVWTGFIWLRIGTSGVFF
jgi:hypothetical protein